MNKDEFDLDKFIREETKDWILEDINIPIEFLEEFKNPIFGLLNNAMILKHKRENLLLPNFKKAETVLIFSDYGGESSDSKYFTYSFVIVDYKCINAFAEGMEIIRKEYFPECINKEISFKDSGYGPIKRSIEKYLYFSNTFLNGLVFTLIVDKKISSLLTVDNSEGLKKMSEYFQNNELGEWKPKVLEKGLRIISIIAFLCKLLIPNEKNVFWMTDSDSIMPNDIKTQFMVKIFRNVLNSIKNPPKYRKIGYSPSPFIGEDGLFFRDVLSIADLVAGSLEQYYTKRNMEKEFEVNEVADKTLAWLSVQGVGLKKLSFVIRKKDDNYEGAFLDIETKNPLENVKQVDYIYNVKINKEKA